MRDGVEKPNELLDLARSGPVALLVVGDPMQATTHIDLEERCVEEGIGFHVIPGLTATALAVSLSGLQSYRFGRQVTIPFSVGEYLPTSPLQMICDNRDSGLHTLVLLDLDPTGMGVEEPRPMVPGEAVALLERMSQRSEGDSPDDEAIREWLGRWQSVQELRGSQSPLRRNAPPDRCAWSPASGRRPLGAPPGPCGQGRATHRASRHRRASISPNPQLPIPTAPPRWAAEPRYSPLGTSWNNP